MVRNQQRVNRNSCDTTMIMVMRKNSGVIDLLLSVIDVGIDEIPTAF